MIKASLKLPRLASTETLTYDDDSVCGGGGLGVEFAWTSKVSVHQAGDQGNGTRDGEWQVILGINGDGLGSTGGKMGDIWEINLSRSVDHRTVGMIHVRIPQRRTTQRSQDNTRYLALAIT